MTDSSPDRRSSGPDLIVTGRIRTMDADRPEAEAIAVTGGRITAIGTTDTIRALATADTEVLTVTDGVVYPGFVEPHMHYWASAMQLDWVDCSTRDGATFDDVLARLREAQPAQGDWVLGRLYDPALVDGERELTRDVLDEVSPDRPIMVMNASLHFAYVNSAALAAAGITEDVEDPEGGTFGRDDSGRLNGSLGEVPAMMAMMRVVPPLSQERLLDNIVRINQHAAERGYTRTHDAGTGLAIGPQEVDLLLQLAPRLAGRVTFAVHDYAMDAAIANGLTPFTGDDMCRAIAWKIISDGSNQGRSGFQRENYQGRDFRGAPNYDHAALVDRIRTAHAHGWQVMVHANGDAAIDETIDAYEQALDGRSGMDHRDRIEHCSFAHAEHLDRMAALGLSPSFLIGHLYYWGDAFEERIVGAEKAQLLDPVAGARRRGLRVSTHSDYTVTDFEPLREVQTQVTRIRRGSGLPLNAAEAVDVHTALKAKTVDAAWQVHADDTTGTIEVGKFADLVVLDADPAEVDPSTIADITVQRTIVGGRTVYQA
ncbi:amidohydrolase [Microbacterium esteraromaticum]|uniref:amidohydrolase n=1 Tax=Microbacterium esteraromaticum TaxID=57043 RepID=UPI001CD37B5E|nr:amidohydrolase [Microbacterium esteraromaticum]MCA1305309.1 amidohydrolase [Microbacterium esteraromaticum]